MYYKRCTQEVIDNNRGGMAVEACLGRPTAPAAGDARTALRFHAAEQVLEQTTALTATTSSELFEFRDQLGARGSQRQGP